MAPAPAPAQAEAAVFVDGGAELAAIPTSLRVFSTSDDLARVGPALLFFVASWCGPCRPITRVQEAVASALAPQVPVYLVDGGLVDPKTPGNLLADLREGGVAFRGFPTVIFVAEGGALTEYPADRVAGALVPQDLAQFVCGASAVRFDFCPPAA